MKKYLIMAAMMLCVFSVYAEDGCKWTLKAGLGASNIGGKDAETDFKFSYKVGLTYDASISPSFSIIPGVEFINKGYSQSSIDGALNAFYFQVPILAAYKISLSDNAVLAIKAGPNIACGIVGSDITWYDSNETTNYFDDIKRFDVGITVGAHVDVKRFQIGLEYNRGFIKVFDGYDFKCFNQSFGATLGYRF